MVYILYVCPEPKCNIELTELRSTSHVQTIKFEHAGVCMTHHYKWLTTSSYMKHYTDSTEAQKLIPGMLERVVTYISSKECPENLGRNKLNLRIFPGWFPYCFSSLHGIETTLDFYMIKEICGTNPRNLFLFPCLTPPGDRKDKMLHLHP